MYNVCINEEIYFIKKHSTIMDFLLYTYITIHYTHYIYTFFIILLCAFIPNYENTEIVC